MQQSTRYQVRSIVGAMMLAGALPVHAQNASRTPRTPAGVGRRSEKKRTRRSGHGDGLRLITINGSHESRVLTAEELRRATQPVKSVPRSARRR